MVYLKTLLCCSRLRQYCYRGPREVLLYKDLDRYNMIENIMKLSLYAEDAASCYLFVCMSVTRLLSCRLSRPLLHTERWRMPDGIVWKSLLQMKKLEPCPPSPFCPSVHISSSGKSEHVTCHTIYVISQQGQRILTLSWHSFDKLCIVQYRYFSQLFAKVNIVQVFLIVERRRRHSPSRRR